MNSKGFTLIELLITIGLIAVVTTIIVVNTGSLLNKKNSDNIEDIKESITDAACSYIDSEGNEYLREKCKDGAICQVPLSLLISNGLVDSSIKDKETNKTLEDEQNEVYVDVSWQIRDTYKEKVCTFVRGSVNTPLPSIN